MESLANGEIGNPNVRWNAAAEQCHGLAFVLALESVLVKIPKQLIVTLVRVTVDTTSAPSKLQF